MNILTSYTVFPIHQSWKDGVHDKIDHIVVWFEFTNTVSGLISQLVRYYTPDNWSEPLRRALASVEGELKDKVTLSVKAAERALKGGNELVNDFTLEGIKFVNKVQTGHITGHITVDLYYMVEGMDGLVKDIPISEELEREIIRNSDITARRIAEDVVSQLKDRDLIPDDPLVTSIEVPEIVERGIVRFQKQLRAIK